MVPRTDEEEADHLASRALLARLPQLRVEDPYGVIHSCSINDLHKVSQWFFASQVDDNAGGRSWIAVSSKNWGQDFWNVASQSEIGFAYLMFLVVHKQTVLTGRKNLKDYYLMQNRVIKLIQQSVNTSFACADPGTALTICGLALFALREGDLTAAKAHMTAVQAISRVHYVQDDPCWIMCTWLDLFIATAGAWHPFLPYQLPAPSESFSVAAPHRMEEARRNALKASKSMPRLRPDFGSHEAFEVLMRINEACFAAEDRDIVLQPPTNLLYCIAFHLCKLFTSVESHHRILILVLQLTWLSAARFWLPQARPLWPSLVVRLDATLQACPDIVAKWQEGGGLMTLLWVALAGYQNARQCFPGLAIRFVSIARCTRELLGIARLHDFRRHMSAFPGIPTQKEAAVRALWETIRPNPSSQWVAMREDDPPGKRSTTKKSHTSKFITIFQFEDDYLDDESNNSQRHWINNWGENAQMERPQKG